MPSSSDHDVAAGSPAQQTLNNPIAGLLEQLHTLLTSINLPKTASAKNCSVSVDTVNKALSLTNSLINHSKDTPTLRGLCNKIDSLAKQLNPTQSYAKAAANSFNKPSKYQSQLPPEASTALATSTRHNPTLELILVPIDRSKRTFTFVSSDLSTIHEHFNSIITKLNIRALNIYNGQPGNLALAKSISHTRGGGYRITFRSKQEREAACSEPHYQTWLEKFSSNLQSVDPEFPIIVHGIPTSFDAHIDSEDVLKLCQENWHDPEEGTKGISVLYDYDISRVHWIRNMPVDQLRSTKKYSSLVIYFRDAAIANEAITNQIAVNGIVRRTEKYRALPMQCFKCRKYGHISALCKNDSKCGFCAGNHLTRDCKCPASTPCATTAQCTHLGTKCSACGGAHRDTDPTCSVRKAALSHALERHALTGPLYPIPA
jgi:hypothetical protein